MLRAGRTTIIGCSAGFVWTKAKTIRSDQVPDYLVEHWLILFDAMCRFFKNVRM